MGYEGYTPDSKEDNITGWNTFEWMPGRFFLKSSGEIIGYDPATDTFPLNMDGKTLTGGWRTNAGEEQSDETIRHRIK